MPAAFFSEVKIKQWLGIAGLIVFPAIDVGCLDLSFH